MVGGGAATPGSVWLEVARAVQLTQVLPGVRVQGGAGGARLRRWVAGARQEPVGVWLRELAGVLVDAQTFSELVRSGAAERAQRRAVRRARAVWGSVPVGLVPAEVAQRAVAAVAAAARLGCLAQALDGPDRAAAVDQRASELAEHRERAGDAGWLPRLLSDEVVSEARCAAVARAAAAALADSEPALDAAAGVLAGQLRERSAAGGPDAGERLRERLAVASRGRVQRAAGLTGRLLAALGAVDRRVSGVPAAWPADPGLLGWLRGRTHRKLYTRAFEQTLAGRWLGGDPFGLRVLQPPPEFLAGVAVDRLRAEQVAPLLRRISLTRPAPAAGELAAVLAAEAGPVSIAGRGRRLRRWGQPACSGAPRLPRRTRIPRVVHGIWLGTPFHAGAPMTLHAAYTLEMAKQLPRGYASASDHLRVEIIHRLGGLYADGDMIFAPPGTDEPDRPNPKGWIPPLPDSLPEGVPGFFSETLPEFFDRLAGSVPGFTMNPNPLGNGLVGADMLAAPAGHPAIRLWLECARLNYFWNQPDMFGGLRAMAMPYVGYRWQENRYMAPHRSGRVHYQVLALLGMRRETLPPVWPAVKTGRELSWLPPAGGEPVAALRHPEDADHVVGVLARCLTFLRWQLAARDGNLYLSAVDPVIRGLPDPDAAWTALLAVLPALAGGLPVSSVTDLRRNDDGRLQAVLLPPEAEARLDRTAAPVRWLGSPLTIAAAPLWLLDERVTPAALRGRGPQTSCLDTLAPLAEVAFNAAGHRIGVWLRSPRDACRWRQHPRFAALPAGHVGLALGSPAPDSIAHLGVHPDVVAALLLHLGLADRPVQLILPADGVDAARPLAQRLRELLDQPVRLATTADPAPAPDLLRARQISVVHHVPLVA